MVFEETQRLSPLAILSVFAIVAATVIVALVAMGAAERATAFPVFAGVIVFTLLLIAALRMRTTVADGLLTVRSVYVYRWAIPLADIAKADPVTYRPIRDYGGWGIRRSRKGRALNMAGNRGVQIVTRSGDRILIGSQRPGDLAAALAVDRA